jgi:hypothetical protein
MNATGVIPPVAGPIEAFVAAAAMKADGIEMDAWRSRSGTSWVMHDPTVDRTTDGTGLIADLSDADMARLTIEVGSAEGGGGVTSEMRPPALTDALAALEEYEGGLIVLEDGLGIPDATPYVDGWLTSAERRFNVRAFITNDLERAQRVLAGGDD